MPIYLDGCSLTIQELYNLGYCKEKIKIALSEATWNKVRKARKVIDDIIKEGRVVYGINTGFGRFATTHIPPDQCALLQRNLIRSHASGIGTPLTPQRTRMLLALRINVLAKGYSGISEKNLRILIDAFNSDCLSKVPEKGTVGASGDLAPLSHLALGLMGEGEMWDLENNTFAPASEILARNNISPIELGAKEGLALINGTQLISSLCAEAVCRANNILICADIIASLTLEALKGSTKAFKEEVHLARPHKGQINVAERLRTLLHNENNISEISQSHANCNRVQDSYTLRCIPQVHGVVEDTIKFVSNTITTELNSATDNPMILADLNLPVSAGNFHGEYPAKMCDFLTIAVHELANISERRIERLMNPDLSGQRVLDLNIAPYPFIKGSLPAFLVPNGGLNSGFMIAHCTAAALTSENKTLCFPASCDTLSTSAAKEDHVSMGGWAARKCLEVLSNVEVVLAIELLCACQGVEYRGKKTTPILQNVIKCLRKEVANFDEDRHMSPDIEKAVELIRNGSIVNSCSKYLRNDENRPTSKL